LSALGRTKLKGLERSIAMNTIRRYLPTAARLFLGLVFTVFGLNFFLHFLPMPAAPPRAAAFAGALFASGYFFPLLKTTEVVAGVLLLTGRFVPLALAVLAPIVVNIVGFHLFLEPSGLPVPLGMLAAEIFLGWSYRAAFASMLHARTPLSRPTQTASAAPEPLRAAA
jgi:uncharacterized membrane protein YphA (DoxX/SURF4 family)